MDEKVFAFWEGDMPGYIKLCMDTWKVPYTLLNYDNLDQYTDLPIEKLKRYSLSQISDCVRVHVLRDNGGYWIDADTIMISDRLPEETILGYPDSRINTCGFLHTEPQTQMFKDWAEYQDKVIDDAPISYYWGTFANAFTDPYLLDHKEVDMGLIENRWPETYMVGNPETRYRKYQILYFEADIQLSDLRKTDLLMLHNSWTPGWYKQLTEEEVLKTSCTLSNILKGLTA